MSTPVKPYIYAEAADYDSEGFVEAVKNGVSEYDGLPIGSWRQNGGEYLSVPDDHAAQLGIGDTQSDITIPASMALARGTRDQPDSKGLGEAFGEAGPPMSANAGAAYAAGQFAGTVREQPQVMEAVADTAVLLGSAGLGYAVTEEGEVVKAGVVTAGLFATWKLMRYATQAGTRTGMQGRQHRQQTQRDPQPQQDYRGDRISKNGNPRSS